MKGLCFVKLGKPEIKFAKECLELLKTQRISESKLRVGSDEVQFYMPKFLDTSECGTSCCIAGLHALNNKSIEGKTFDNTAIVEYLQYAGIRKKHIMQLYDFLLASNWPNSIEFAIIRLEFIIRHLGVLELDYEDGDLAQERRVIVRSEKSSRSMSQRVFHKMLQSL